MAIRASDVLGLLPLRSQKVSLYREFAIPGTSVPHFRDARACRLAGCVADSRLHRDERGLTMYHFHLAASPTHLATIGRTLPREFLA